MTQIAQKIRKNAAKLYEFVILLKLIKILNNFNENRVSICQDLASQDKSLRFLGLGNLHKLL